MRVNTVLRLKEYFEQACGNPREVSAVLLHLLDELQHHGLILDDSNGTYTKQLLDDLRSLNDVCEPPKSMRRSSDEEINSDEKKLEAVVRRFEYALENKLHIARVMNVNEADVFLSGDLNNDEAMRRQWNSIRDSVVYLQKFCLLRDKRNIVDVCYFNTESDPQECLKKHILDPFLKYADTVNLYDPYLAQAWWDKTFSAKANKKTQWEKFLYTTTFIIDTWLNSWDANVSDIEFNIYIPNKYNSDGNWSELLSPRIKQLRDEVIRTEWHNRAIFNIKTIKKSRDNHEHHDRYLWTKYGSIMFSTGFSFVRDDGKLGHAVLRYDPNGATDLDTRMKCKESPQ